MPSCPSKSTVSAVDMVESSRRIFVPKHIDNYPRVRNSHCDSPLAKAVPALVVPMPLVRIPSAHSAFRPIQAPPIPPKSNAVRIRAIRLSSLAPPLFPRSSDPSVELAPGWTPTPKPRLSKMKSMTDLSVQPTPLPRKISGENRQNCEIDVDKINALKSSPVTRGCSVASVKRRNGAHRPATPLLTTPTQQPSATPSFPTMDESERAFLEEAVRQSYSQDTSDSESECSAPYARRIHFPRKPSTQQSSLPSPTDSGLPISDEEKRRPASSKSLDDGFFDASVAKKDDEDSASEALTSISNTKPVEAEEQEDRGRGVSAIEKNARVMRWIHCQAAK